MNEFDSEIGDPSAIDTGEPIAILKNLEESASRTFGERLRMRIQRRQFSADLGRFGWDGPISVVVEFFRLFFDMIGGAGADESKGR